MKIMRPQPIPSLAFSCLAIGGLLISLAGPVLAQSSNTPHTPLAATMQVVHWRAQHRPDLPEIPANGYLLATLTPAGWQLNRNQPFHNNLPTAQATFDPQTDVAEGKRFDANGNEIKTPACNPASNPNGTTFAVRNFSFRARCSN